MVYGPGFKEPVCKRLAKSEGASFNDEKHIERRKTLLRNVENDKPDAKEA